MDIFHIKMQQIFNCLIDKSPGDSYLKSHKKIPVKTRITYSICLGLLSLCAFAQPESAFQGKILGKWSGTGSLFGKDASFSMTWEAPLGAHFLSLKFHNSYTASPGVDRSMDAQAYYNLQTGRGYWFDSRGQELPLQFEIKGDTMLVFWGSEETEKGKTLYTVGPSGAEVRDFVYRGQEYAPFGTASYQKTD